MNYSKRQQNSKKKTEDYYRRLVSGNGCNASAVKTAPEKTAAQKKSVPAKKKKKGFIARFFYALKKTGEDNRARKQAGKQPAPEKKQTPKSKTDTFAKLSDTISDYRTKPMPEKKRRRRNAFFYIFVLIICVGIIITICCLFFKVGKVTPAGYSRYTAEEIVDFCGIEYETNIFSVSKESVRDTLCTSLPYIKDVEVKRHLPSEILLNVTETSPVAAVKVYGGYALLNEDCKILEISGTQKGLPVYKGLDITGDVVPGLYAQFDSEDAKEIIAVMSASLTENGLTEVVSEVNAEKRYDISFVANGSITCVVSDLSDIDSKIGMIKVVLDKNSKTMKAVIDASDPERVYYRPTA